MSDYWFPGDPNDPDNKDNKPGYLSAQANVRPDRRSFLEKAVDGVKTIAKGLGFKMADNVDAKVKVPVPKFDDSPRAPQHPVSHPGHIPVPIHRTGAANGGHATVHPPVPHTSPMHPARHTRPPHAVAKATAGTQHTNSSGSKAAAPAKKHKKHKKKPVPK